MVLSLRWNLSLDSGFLTHFHLILWRLYGGARPVALAMCRRLWNYNYLHYLHLHLCKLIGAGLNRNSVADPGFPRGGGANPKGGDNLLFGQFFSKTAWKWRKFAPGGRPSRPLRYATEIVREILLRLAVRLFNALFGPFDLRLRLFCRGAVYIVLLAPKRLECL